MTIKNLNTSICSINRFMNFITDDLYISISIILNLRARQLALGSGGNIYINARYFIMVIIVL